jgi:hypothetical protein
MEHLNGFFRDNSHENLTPNHEIFKLVADLLSDVPLVRIFLFRNDELATIWMEIAQESDQLENVVYFHFEALEMCRKWFLQLEEGTALVLSTPSISKEAEIAEQKATCSRISSGSAKAAPGRLECDLQCPKMLVRELIAWNMKRLVALAACRCMLKPMQNAFFRLQILNLFVSRLYRTSRNQMLRRKEKSRSSHERCIGADGDIWEFG